MISMKKSSVNAKSDGRCKHQVSMIDGKFICDITKKKCRHSLIPEICKNFDVDDETLNLLIASSLLCNDI